KYDSTMKSLEQKCSKGNIKSCLTRGKFHLYSYGNTAMHENKALEFFQKACQKNNADGCAYIAYLEKDENKSFKLYEQACDKGSSLACAFYAAHFSPKVFSYNPDITRKAAKAQYSKDLFNILYKACLLQDPDDYTLQHSIIENEKYEYHFLDKIEHRFCRQAKYHKKMVEKNSIPLVDIDL
ncbi:MAG: sel1 repeat family protein, partial [Neisseriaceae bacterium]|nr:sel1 repeat family protein [Neisseriaceae bacterium]